MFADNGRGTERPATSAVQHRTAEHESIAAARECAHRGISFDVD